MRRVLVALAGAGAMAWSPLACGPSFQAIYEGNARFEHCYALEENAQTIVHEKADCWRDWSERYTFGQTRDRIHYATARYVALSQSTNVPTDEAMMMAAPGMTPRQSTITAPAPTNAFAPPPKVLEEYGDAAPGRPPRPSEQPIITVFGQPSVDSGTGTPAPTALPAATCTIGCGQKHRDCTEACASSGDAGTAAAKDAACKACDKTYRACMRACFP